MRRAAESRRQGFTVMELVMSIGLIAAVIAGLGGVARTAVRLTQHHEGRLDVQQGTRRALERIVEELRWAEGVVSDPSCGPGGLCPQRVSVRIPGGNPYRQSAAYEVTFQHNARQQEVERRVGQGTTNLASLIQRVEFTYLDRHGAPATQPDAVARIRVELVTVPRGRAPMILQADAALRNRRRSGAAAPSPGPTTVITPAWRPVPRRSFGPGGPSFRGSRPPDDGPGLR